MVIWLAHPLRFFRDFCTGVGRRGEGRENKLFSLVSDFSPTLAKGPTTLLSHFQKQLWYGFLMLANS